jgi:hypothetical protein
MSPPLFVVAKTPALLAGMAYPRRETDWDELYRQGFRRLVRLHPGDYDAAPLVVHDVALEDLFGGGSPRDPVAEERRVRKAAGLAVDFVVRGEGVLVHCVGGTGRTGTVLACALRRLGHTADEAIGIVREQRPHWPESAWQEDVVRRMPEVP